MLTYELQERGICLLAEYNGVWAGRCYDTVTAKGCCRVRQAIISSTRGRGEVLGQAGVAKACAYTLIGV